MTPEWVQVDVLIGVNIFPFSMRVSAIDGIRPFSIHQPKQSIFYYQGKQFRCMHSYDELRSLIGIKSI